MQRSRICVHVLGFAAAFVGLRGGVAEGQWHYYYFDQPRPLTVDLTEVAVFVQTDGRAMGAVSSSLSKHGIQAGDVRDSAIPGMFLVTLPAPARQETSIQALVKSTAGEEALEFVSPVFLDARGDPVIITRHLHVGFHRQVSAEDAEALLAKSGAGVIEERNWSRMQGVYRLLCHSRDGFDVLETANALAQRPEIRFAEPDMVVTARKHLIPDDPYFPNLWGLHNTGQSGGTEDIDMDAPEAWDILTGDESIIVVVIDDGVQQNHPDLNQIPGRDFTGSGTGGGPDNECDNHGTAVAGCVSAIINNGLGVVGSAPGCKVASAKYSVSSVPCDGGGSFYISWFVSALNWAQTIGARVTNTSSGFEPQSTITSKFASTRAAGIVHFAAVDNYAGEPLGYPADLSTVNAVAAANRNGIVVSATGSGLAFTAPGVSVGTTDRTGADGYSSGDYAFKDGTSFASPYTAGVAALVLSLDPTLTPDGVEALLRDTCMDLGAAGHDATYGWGFVNAFGALRALPGSVETCQLGDMLTAPIPAAGDDFGYSVAADGKTVVIGAPDTVCLSGAQCGAAYVYTLTGNDWSAADELTASDADSGAVFGSAVAIRGDLILVGAPDDDPAGQADAGSAYLFRWNSGTDTWDQEQKLMAPVVAANSQFGAAVAISEDSLFVGVPNDGNIGGADNGTGAVYIFQYDGAEWVHEDTLNPSDGEAGDGFGSSISVGSGLAAVGSTGADCGGGEDCGAAYVFRFGEAGWVEEQILTDPDGLAYDWFGYSVSMADGRLLIGAPLADDAVGSNCGAVFVYDPLGPVWVQRHRFAGTGAGDLYGWSVAHRRSVGFVGCPSRDCSAGTNCGEVYIVRRTEEGWETDGHLSASDEAAGSSYGHAVALSSCAALVAARLYDLPGADNAGAAYAYALPVDCNDTGLADLCDILTGASEDVDGDCNPDECLCEPSSAAVAEMLDLPSAPVSRKIRYLSLIAGDEGQLQAVRVTFGNVPSPYDHWNGTALWVQQPQVYCENAGVSQNDPCPESVGGLPSTDFWGAELGCDPFVTDWAQYDIVHVFNEGIIPGGTYDVQVIDETCPLDVEEGFSDALTLTQSIWADLIQDCTTTPCQPPDGNTGIVDVTAILDKWKNLPGNVKKVRADIEGSPAGDHRLPDQAINITDVTYCLGAFLGDTYPPSGFPPPSDPPSCP